MMNKDKASSSHEPFRERKGFLILSKGVESEEKQGLYRNHTSQREGSRPTLQAHQNIGLRGPREERGRKEA